MKKVLVNYASAGREKYILAQNRLIDSFIESDWNGEYLIRSPEPRTHNDIVIIDKAYRSHKDVPYGFKVDIFSEAKKLGYKKIMWCDSTIVRSGRRLDFIFELAKELGVVCFHNLGHDLHKYISDQAAARLGILSDPNFETIHQVMACVIVFDFDVPIAETIFNEWEDASYVQGLFQNGSSVRPEFKAHRHDQAVLSAILYEYGIPLLKYGHLVYEPHDMTKEYGDEIYFINKAI